MVRNYKSKFKYYVLKNKKLIELDRNNEDLYRTEQKYHLNSTNVDLNENYVLIRQYNLNTSTYVPIKEKDQWIKEVSIFNRRRREKGFEELSSHNSHLYMRNIVAKIIESYPSADINMALNLIMTSGRLNNEILQDVARGDFQSFIKFLNEKRTNQKSGKSSPSLNEILISNFDISLVDSDFYAEFYELSTLDIPSRDTDDYDFLFQNRVGVQGVGKE